MLVKSTQGAGLIGDETFHFGLIILLPCYVPSFVEICLPVPEKKIFEGFLPYIGVAAILVM